MNSAQMQHEGEQNQHKSADLAGDEVPVEPGDVLFAQAQQKLPQDFPAGSQHDHRRAKAEQDACKAAGNQRHAAGEKQHRECVHKGQRQGQIFRYRILGHPYF